MILPTRLIPSLSFILLGITIFPSPLGAIETKSEPTTGEASAALDRAITFFRKEVATSGAYVYRYSADLKKREGEGKVGDTTGWTQPPGTPSVGEALVAVYELSGNRNALAAARESAAALAATQLHSGGWDARIELSGEARKRYAYRVDGNPGKRARNHSSLDDDKTQSCIRFLLLLDRATRFEDKAIHELTVSALKSLLTAQFPNGAWPQVYRTPAQALPVLPASYAKDGEYHRIKNYWDYYTLNDNLVSDAVETLFLAEEVYGNSDAASASANLALRSREAAERAGDFLILAQMPEPQPGWAQQYDFQMRPMWARKFEPPAMTGSESQSVMMTLLGLYERTGKKKFLKPIPPALKYYRGSLLPDGRLARFYELQTNKPLYFTRDYKLTFSDADVPTHYSFKTSSKLDRIEKRYQELSSKPWQAPAAPPSPGVPSAKSVHQIIAAMDARGAWVEEGRLRYWGEGDPTTRVIETSTFARNVRTLARFAGRE